MTWHYVLDVLGLLARAFLAQAARGYEEEGHGAKTRGDAQPGEVERPVEPLGRVVAQHLLLLLRVVFFWAVQEGVRFDLVFFSFFFGDSGLIRDSEMYSTFVTRVWGWVIIGIF